MGCTCLVSTFILFFVCILLAWVPYYFNLFKTAQHYCGKCDKFIGKVDPNLCSESEKQTLPREKKKKSKKDEKMELTSV